MLLSDFISVSPKTTGAASSESRCSLYTASVVFVLALSRAKLNDPQSKLPLRYAVCQRAVKQMRNRAGART